MVFGKAEENNFEEEREEEPAAFNDALKTLSRITEPLQEIQHLDYLYKYDTPEKQRAFISIVERFFILCSPLLKQSDSDKYQKEVLSFQLNKKLSVKSGVQQYKDVYDPSIDYRLKAIVIELQRLLKKYLMPTRREDDGL